MGYSKNKRQNANIWNFRSEMESLATFSMVLIGSLGIVDDSNKNFKLFSMEILTYSTYFYLIEMGYSKNKRQNANIWNFRSEMESLATFSMVLIGSLGIVDDSNKNI